MKKNSDKGKKEVKGNLLKTKDVAHILDVSPDDVIELARKGKIRAHKKGRFWCIWFADAVAYQKKTANS